MARYGYDLTRRRGRYGRGGYGGGRYDESFRRGGRYAGRRYDTGYYGDRYTAGPPPDYDDDIGEDRPMGAVPSSQERMGMRDFMEGYGRYSGGSPYSYTYSERTIYHRPRFTGMIGFTRPLEEDRYTVGRRQRPTGGPERVARWRRGR